MVTRSNHGGYCCGAQHLYNFNYHTTKEEIEMRLAQTRQYANQGQLVEVILTNRQCKELPNVPKWLQEIGFKLVNRFKNPNSGNICNVFHYNSSPRSLTSRLPFKIIEPNN